MPATRELDPSASALAFFGAELRRARLAAGKTQEQVARAITYSPALVGQVETAVKRPPPDFAERCDKAFGTNGYLGRLWEHWVSKELRREGYPSYFQSFPQIEREATTLRVFEPLAIPGLLQTEDYARALLRATMPDATTDQIEEYVAARMERQAILDHPNPPTLIVLADEGVFTRSVGGPQVMAGQLSRLERASEQPKIALQVVPASSEAGAGLGGTCTIASSNGHEVVYFETAATGRLVDAPEEVAACTVVYDMLRAEALPREPSVNLIRKRRGEYEHASQVA